MSYTIDRVFEGASISDIDARTRKALAEAGFGVLTEIDVKTTLKKKIGKDMPGYLTCPALSRMSRLLFEPYEIVQNTNYSKLL